MLLLRCRNDRTFADAKAAWREYKQRKKALLKQALKKAETKNKATKNKTTKKRK
jgi:hypothetical protein